MNGQTLWLLGLPASGKTTLAAKIVHKCVGYVLLDGDDVRDTVQNFDMSQNARLIHLSYMALCCQHLNKCGINVVAAFVTPMEQQRTRIRQILPEVKFIWLKCRSDICAVRDPKGLWAKSYQGRLTNLTGADGTWEDPTKADLTISTDAISIDDGFAAIVCKFGLVPRG